MDNDEFLQKFDAFCFKYQNVDCMYTLFKYRFSGKTPARRGQVFDNVQKAVYFKEKQRRGQIAQHCKKETVEKKIEKLSLRTLHQTK